VYFRGWDDFDDWIGKTSGCIVTQSSNLFFDAVWSSESRRYHFYQSTIHQNHFDVVQWRKKTWFQKNKPLLYSKLGNVVEQSCTLNLLLVISDHVVSFTYDDVFQQAEMTSQRLYKFHLHVIYQIVWKSLLETEGVKQSQFVARLGQPVPHH
jgi:hypothetical protein